MDPQKSTEKQVSMPRSDEPHNDLKNSTSDVPVVDSASVSISSNKSRRITRQDIEVVQNLVERCLQLYMNRNEVISTLLDRARIEPGFTTLVLQKLEEENADFFKAYYIRLKLKNQILVFNRLLEQQYHLMNNQVPQEVPLPSMQSGMCYMPEYNLPMGYPILQQPLISSKGRESNSMGTLSNCHVVKGVPAQGNFHHMPLNRVNETLVDATSSVKTEMVSSPVSVASNGQFPFAPSEIQGINAGTSVHGSAFTSHLENLERLGIGLDGGNRCSKESLQLSGQNPWNFGFFDNADWQNMQDLGALGSYSGSPFLSESDVLLDSPEQNDMVEEFFVDPGPSQGSQSE